MSLQSPATVALLLLALAAPHGRPVTAPIVLAASGVTLDQAVAMAERQYQARVVRTEVREEDGRKVYVLRLLSDSGRVWVVKVDAESGAMR